MSVPNGVSERKSSKVVKTSSPHDELPSYDSNTPDEAIAQDELAVLGYQSELVRSRSTAQVAFMSFVLSSVPYGLATTLFYPINGGGPATIIWGWVSVCLIILCLSASLGEITSVYPTAGGVYYQTFMLSPRGSQRILAWICGWSYTLGNIIITLSVNFGTTLFLVGCINIFQDADGVGIFAATTYQIYLIFLAITIITNLISSLANKYLPMLDTATIFWTFGGTFAILICTLAIAKNGRNSAEYAFTHFEPLSGWTPGWAFCVGLLHAAYATSAMGMILSMCEEVRKPSTQVPVAMIWSISLIFLCGIILLIPLCFVLPDLAAIIADPYAQPLPFILRSAIGSEGGAFALTVPLIILGILCGVSCTTAASRCTWAFARDGAMPGSKWWKKVNQKLDVPLNAMMLSMVIQLLLGLVYFGSTAAFNAFNGSGVIFLTLSYVMPIFVSFIGGRKAVTTGSFYLGKLGAFCNVVSIAWCALAIPLFSMPASLPVTETNMNYACAVFVGGICISLIYYFVRGRKTYVGPPAEGTPDEVARRRSEISMHSRH